MAPGPVVAHHGIHRVRVSRGVLRDDSPAGSFYFEIPCRQIPPSSGFLRPETSDALETESCRGRAVKRTPSNDRTWSDLRCHDKRENLILYQRSLSAVSPPSSCDGADDGRVIDALNVL